MVVEEQFVELVPIVEAVPVVELVPFVELVPVVEVVPDAIVPLGVALLPAVPVLGMV